MASDVKGNPVDGDEALELLDQRAETTLARLQTAWLPGFLEEQGERFVHLVVHEVIARDGRRAAGAAGASSAAAPFHA